MNDATPELPQEGGSWIREPDGSLRREEEPTKRPLPHEPVEEQAPEPVLEPAPAPAGGRRKPAGPEAPAAPLTES